MDEKSMPRMLNTFINIHPKLPEGLVVLISGVPGAGKTTISYELLKSFDEFRIIEETDLIREILRGYNQYIQKRFGKKASFFSEKVMIHDNMKFLTLDEAKQQSQHMRTSLEKIIMRQQRKGISTIINGIHIVPEVLNGIAQNRNLCFINLFVSSEVELSNRLRQRDPKKYNTENIAIAFQTNLDLYISTKKIETNSKFLFNNIDVSFLTVEKALEAVTECIKKRIEMIT